MSLFALTAAVLGRAAYQWWQKSSPSSRPVTGFTYRLLPVPHSEESRFRLQNPHAILAYGLYRELASQPDWASAAEIMLAKAQRMARENSNCEIYILDLTPTYG